MTSPNLPRLTNLWSKITTQGGQNVSCVAIESFHPLRFSLSEENQAVTLVAQEAIANMHCATLPVYDGLLEEIAVWTGAEKNIFIRITLCHQAPCQVSRAPGIPARTFLYFDRSFLNTIFSTRNIVIDPGHGGSDTGGKGPVNLLEKNVVLTMARYAKKHLDQAGARVILTREQDQDLSLANRLNLAKENKAHLFLSFHTGFCPNAKTGGIAVNYNPNDPDGQHLAQIFSKELGKKLKRASGKVRPAPGLAGLGAIPGLEVKPLTISNWVEEGLLRNPTIYEKIALSILNSLRIHFSKDMP